MHVAVGDRRSLDDAVETATAEIAEPLQDKRQLDGIARQADDLIFCHGRRHRADKSADRPFDDLLKHALNDRLAVLRQRDPDLHGGRRQDRLVPYLYQQRIAAAPAERAEQADEPVAHRRKRHAADHGGADGKVAGRPGAVGNLDNQLVLAFRQAHDEAGQRRRPEGATG